MARRQAEQGIHVDRLSKLFPESAKPHRVIGHVELTHAQWNALKLKIDKAFDEKFVDKDGYLNILIRWYDARLNPCEGYIGVLRSGAKKRTSQPSKTKNLFDYASPEPKELRAAPPRKRLVKKYRRVRTKQVQF